MRFGLNHALLREAGTALSKHVSLFWIVGGAGSGKTSTCQTLSREHGIPVYDMDARIYGTYHQRFLPDRHPVNYAWSKAADGLAWLLDMSWEDFDDFNRAAAVEYLDLLAGDLAGRPGQRPLVIDGGICNPSILLEALPRAHILCLRAPHMDSRRIWESEERVGMKAFMAELPNAEEAWERFLEHDSRITRTILSECEGNGIEVFARGEDESIDLFASRVAAQVLAQVRHS